MNSVVRCASAVKANRKLVPLRHASPRKNVRAIHANGLLPWLAKGKLKAIWLLTPRRTSWAVEHIARRHKVAVADVVVFDVLVPRAQLRRRRRGIWTCDVRILPDAITATNGLRIVG